MGSKKWEVGGQKSKHEALSLNGQKWEIRSSNFVKSEVWSLKYEVWSLKSEVWSLKSEVGSRKSEVGRPSSAFVVQVFIDDRSTIFCLTPVSAMVSIKISRRKFPRPRPGTSALLVLLRLTAVKLGGSLWFYNLGILGLTRKIRKCDGWHKVRNGTEYGRKYSHIFLTLPSPHPLPSFLPCLYTA